MAVVLPMLTFLAMGLAEFGQFFYVRMAFESAVRDAMRCAIPAAAKQGDPAAAATATLAAAGITFDPSWMVILDTANGYSTVTDCSTVPAGHGLITIMFATYAALPNACRPLSSFCGVGIGSGKQIVCKCTMVKE
jgi:hypothetical protein